MTSGCAGTLRLQSLSEFYTASLGDTVEVSLLLCFTTESEVDTTVDLKLMLPEGMPEIVVTGGDFSESGENSTGITGTTDCIPLTVLISVDTSASPGDIISIPITVETPPGFCDQSDSVHSTIHLYIVDAENSTCLCENENGNVNLKGNIKLSAAIQKGYFGDPNSPPNIPPCISINGTLTVDIPFFYISNCKILLGPAARIFISPNSSLFLRGNHIHGCDYLWHSISKAGKGTLLAEDNLIEDGLFALSYHNSPFLDNAPIARVSKNKFNKNFIGVANIFNNIDAGKVNFQTFSANEFTCENEILLSTPNPLLSFPSALSKSYAGVYLLQLENSINLSGLPSSGENHFHHLQNGIIVSSKNLIVRNTRFSNIPVNADYENSNYGNGNGIHSFGGLTQSGGGQFSTAPDFTSVKTAIYSRSKGAQISIRNNYMNGVTTGVHISGGIGGVLDITNNTINCDNYGIRLFNIGGYFNTKVKGNHLYVDPPTFTNNPNKGIGISITGLNSFGIPEINNNYIHTYERDYGLYINSGHDGVISENIIYLHNPDAVAGIRIDGSTNVDIACNIVHGYSSEFISGENVGIDINSVRGGFYSCNTIDTTSIGFRFSGVCSSPPLDIRNTKFEANQLTQHGYGLLMQSDAVFGSLSMPNWPNSMVHRGNTWNGDYEKDRAIHYGTLHQIFLTKFTIHTDDIPYYPKSEDQNNPIAPKPPTPNALGTEWFTVDENGSPFICNNSYCTATFNEQYPDSISAFGLAIVQDTLSFTPEFDEAMKETLQRQLYRLLDDHTDLVNQDSSLQQFYTIESSSVMAILTSIDRLKEATTMIDSVSNADLLFWGTAVKGKLDSITLEEAQLPAGPDSSHVAEFEGIQNEYLVEIDSLIQLQRDFFCSIWPSWVALIDSALTLNSGIEPTTQMEANEVSVNQLHLEKVFFGNIDLTTNEKNLLDSIATQCPTLGGNAVFNARAILAEAGWWEYYNDDSLCQVSAPRPVTQTKSLNEKPDNILIYPNPAIDRLTIRPDEQWVGKMDIRITDLLGSTVIYKSIKEINAEDEPIEVSIGGLPSGLFTIHVCIDGQIAGSQKFAKIR